eukprot:Nk52_evm6s222 gene=Nk52_evmTU6s222
MAKFSIKDTVRSVKHKLGNGDRKKKKQEGSAAPNEICQNKQSSSSVNGKVYEDYDRNAFIDLIFKRYCEGHCYTFIGQTVAFLNPPRRSIQTMPQSPVSLDNEYVAKSDTMSSVGDNGYREPNDLKEFCSSIVLDLMMEKKRNVGVLGLGNSGSGKTEILKSIREYLDAFGRTSENKDNIFKCFLCIDVLMEAFGSCRGKTHSNCTRFATVMDVSFDDDGEMDGADISFFFSRNSLFYNQTSSQAAESSFNIFYELLSARKSDVDHRELELGPAQNFRYLASSGSHSLCLRSPAYSRRLRETTDALYGIGISRVEVDDIFRILSAILHLGNIEFYEVKNDDTNSSKLRNNQHVIKLKNNEELHIVCRLLWILPKTLLNILTRPSASESALFLTAEECYRARDGFASLLYKRVFVFIAKRCKKCLRTSSESKRQSKVISLFDLPGYTVAENSSFSNLMFAYLHERVCKWKEEECFRIVNNQASDGVEVDMEAFLQDKELENGLFVTSNVVNTLTWEIPSPYGSYFSLQTKLKRLEEKSERLDCDSRSRDVFCIKHFMGWSAYDSKEVFDAGVGFLEEPLNSLLNDVGIESTIMKATSECDAFSDSFSGKQSVSYRLVEEFAALFKRLNSCDVIKYASYLAALLEEEKNYQACVIQDFMKEWLQRRIVLRSMRALKQLFSEQEPGPDTNAICNVRSTLYIDIESTIGERMLKVKDVVGSCLVFADVILTFSDSFVAEAVYLIVGLKGVVLLPLEKSSKESNDPCAGFRFEDVMGMSMSKLTDDLSVIFFTHMESINSVAIESWRKKEILSILLVIYESKIGRSCPVHIANNIPILDKSAIVAEIHFCEKMDTQGCVCRLECSPPLFLDSFRITKSADGVLNVMIYNQPLKVDERMGDKVRSRFDVAIEPSLVVEATCTSEFNEADASYCSTTYLYENGQIPVSESSSLPMLEEREYHDVRGSKPGAFARSTSSFNEENQGRRRCGRYRMSKKLLKEYDSLCKKCAKDFSSLYEKRARELKDEHRNMAAEMDRLKYELLRLMIEKVGKFKTEAGLSSDSNGGNLESLHLYRKQLLSVQSRALASLQNDQKLRCQKSLISYINEKRKLHRRNHELMASLEMRQLEESQHDEKKEMMKTYKVCLKTELEQYEKECYFEALEHSIFEESLGENDSPKIEMFFKEKEKMKLAIDKKYEQSVASLTKKQTENKIGLVRDHHSFRREIEEFYSEEERKATLYYTSEKAKFLPTCAW